MSSHPMALVTGAFSFGGRYIARSLLDRGWTVKTLTGHPERAALFRGVIAPLPLDFRPDALAPALEGVDALFNTYWIRFERGPVTFAAAVRHCGDLFAAARAAGVSRIVHISVTNADPASPLPYFRGKGQVEAFLRECGVPATVLRPAVVFGEQDVLLNNIAWCLRRLPVVGIPGDGSYRMQPIFAGDLGTLAANAVDEPAGTVDAVGPETLSYRRLVEVLAAAVGSRAALIGLPPRLALLGTRLLGAINGDQMLTDDEVAGLTGGLLYTGAPARGPTAFTTWVQANGHLLGRGYRSEIATHYRPPAG